MRTTGLAVELFLAPTALGDKAVIEAVAAVETVCGPSIFDEVKAVSYGGSRGKMENAYSWTIFYYGHKRAAAMQAITALVKALLDHQPYVLTLVNSNTGYYSKLYATGDV